MGFPNMNDQLIDIKNRQTRRKTAIDNPAVRDIDWLIAEIDSLRKEVGRLESPVAAARVKAESELTDVKASLTYLAMKKRVEAIELAMDQIMLLQKLKTNFPVGGITTVVLWDDVYNIITKLRGSEDNV